MKSTKIALLTAAALFASALTAEAGLTKNPALTGAVHSTFVAVDSTDYYGSGNDDGFAEYGIATFNFDLSDFGGSLTDLPELTYTLTHNDRSFSDGDEFELFLTTDDFDASYTGLSYDAGGANDPNGIDASQYTNLSSLGVFDYTPLAGGTKEVISLSLTTTQEAEIMYEIIGGSDFSIIIAATANADDVTFTGNDDTFEPGGRPVLSFVPEPASAVLVLLAGLVGVARRR